MEFTSDIENSKLIDNFLLNESNLCLAIAFLGESAWKYFKNSKNKILIICNLESGATNPFLIEKLCSKKYLKIRTNKKLHAKVYIGRNQLIVSSANLSANGLSYEDNEIKGWIEASLTSYDKKLITDAYNWFDEVWGESSVITDDDINLAKKVWLKKRNDRVINSTNYQSIIEALFNNEFKDKEVYVTIYRQYSGKEAQEKWANVQENYGKNFDYFEDWDEIPHNAFCIDLYYGVRGKKEIQGIFKTPEYPMIEKFEYDNGEFANLNIVHQVDNILGKYYLSKKDKKIIEDATAKIWEQFNTDNDDALIIKLHDIKQILT